MGERTLDDTDRAMLAIKALDPRASLTYSEYTGQWYIAARIEVSDGSVLKSCAEHRDTPQEAVLAFLDYLIGIGLDEVVVAKPAGQRRHYRWNGGAFVEQYDARLDPPASARSPEDAPRAPVPTAEG